MIEYTVTVNDDCTRFWWLNGKYHREDGPAIEFADGNRYWYLNGNLHREDGPAIERADGTRQWYLNGKRHRIDGPAIEHAYGTRRWYLNGLEYTKMEFLKKTVGVRELTEADIEALLGYQIKVVNGK